MGEAQKPIIPEWNCKFMKLRFIFIDFAESIFEPLPNVQPEGYPNSEAMGKLLKIYKSEDYLRGRVGFKWSSISTLCVGGCIAENKMFFIAFSIFVLPKSYLLISFYRITEIFFKLKY